MSSLSFGSPLPHQKARCAIRAEVSPPVVAAHVSSENHIFYLLSIGSLEPKNWINFLIVVVVYRDSENYFSWSSNFLILSARLEEILNFKKTGLGDVIPDSRVNKDTRPAFSILNQFPKF